MLRVVLDTNVLVSAVISDGTSRELLRRGIAGQFSLVTSDIILKGLRDTGYHRVCGKVWDGGEPDLVRMG